MEKKLLRLIAFSIKLVEEKDHNFDLYYGTEKMMHFSFGNLL